MGHQREDRPEQIELLFNAQRPEVQEGLQLRGGCEIAALEQQQEVRSEGGARQHVTSQAIEGDPGQDDAFALLLALAGVPEPWPLSLKS